MSQRHRGHRWLKACSGGTALGLSIVVAAGAAALTMPGTAAAALAFVFNRVDPVTPASLLHAGASGDAAASYQIDITNTFAIGDTIYLKIEGVADPQTTNAGIGFAGMPSVAVAGPTIGAFGDGAAGDITHDQTPAFTARLESSAGAASVVGINDELVLTVTSSSVGTANDHYTFSVTGIDLDIGMAVPAGNVNLHAYSADGTGSLAPTVTIATVNSAAVQRVAGSDRFATAIALSKQEFPSAGSAGAVVLARSDNYADALVGTSLAAIHKAPILFVSGDSLMLQTQAEIERVLTTGKTVYLLGGVKAIPANVEALLQVLGYNAVRYGGVDRYATALAVADALGDPSTVLLATGTSFADALAAGPAAAKVSGVVLLTAGAALPSAVGTYLADHATTVYAIGGPAIFADPAAIAVVGADRYATAAAIASHFFTAPTSVGVASGTGFADALAGGDFLALTGGPVLLSAPSNLPASTAGYLRANVASLTAASIVGGSAALSNAVRAEIAAALGQ